MSSLYGKLLEKTQHDFLSVTLPSDNHVQT